MQQKASFFCTLLAILVFTAGLIFSLGQVLSSCSQQKTVSASAQLAQEALPFSLPEQFSYQEKASLRYNLPTYTSAGGSTLILSCQTSSPSRLERAKHVRVTVESLEAAFAKAGLTVMIYQLQKQSTQDAVIHTYSVQMHNQNGTTITRKYTVITKTFYLDISCGGDTSLLDTIDEDFASVLSALREETGI